ncbi:hypothetical protein Pyrfu_1554 [Pyrolobus fumarii 1A]|uniref:DUF488 domain-containing protein n=1 Tax=Pyrolobus fumarii (strain DSM 11204 / 1A) TaxID=694429 RepID=G0EHQ8_PYRF1|nr:DUF488 family protein [Pyrolobus fumarii]AEM39411.1 hypothetical protein Pyrfu_1554 [Pyrolobus fumarii 1A]
MSRTVYTLGTSRRSLAELLSILRRLEADAVVDLRRFPRSRRYPWFNKEVLIRVLYERGIRYYWLGWLLGGKTVGDYTKYMCTREYKAGIKLLLEILDVSKNPVLLCAEMEWWRCHRRFVAESLHRRGYRVVHVLSHGFTEEHVGIEESVECY